jgi:hypothetical protein
MRVRLLIVTILLTGCLGIPRFAHYTPDSPHYVNLARYFQGDLQKEQLLKPYANRPLVPLLATLLPIDSLDDSIALINILATIAAYLIFILYMKELGMSPLQVNVGILILVLSFPTFNYSSGVLTDPGGFFMFILGVYLLLKDKYYLLSFSACLGVLVRESHLILVLIAIIDILIRYFYQLKETQTWKKMAKRIIIVSAPSILTFIIIQLYLFPDVRTSFHWGISLQGLLRNISQPKIGWLTFSLTIFPPILLTIYGIHKNGLEFIDNMPLRIKILSFSITIVGIIYIIYSNSIATAYMSGRFVWPFYSILIPVTVLSIQRTSLYERWFEPIGCKILGIPSEKK